MRTAHCSLCERPQETFAPRPSKYTGSCVIDAQQSAVKSVKPRISLGYKLVKGVDRSLGSSTTIHK